MERRVMKRADRLREPLTVLREATAAETEPSTSMADMRGSNSTSKDKMRASLITVIIKRETMNNVVPEYSTIVMMLMPQRNREARLPLWITAVEGTITLLADIKTTLPFLTKVTLSSEAQEEV
jgi:hypothetical protein